MQKRGELKKSKFFLESIIFIGIIFLSLSFVSAGDDTEIGFEDFGSCSGGPNNLQGWGPYNEAGNYGGKDDGSFCMIIENTLCTE
ncbi:MAG TPA: hypothetical protein VMZ91_12885, partial [Candidatus Paceibacterota bacterium]|nr:hypothetical protein [Candidatus Paceibacterota bacterium]